MNIAVDPLAQLTACERDVLALMAQGSTDFGISKRLFVTQKTVEFHARNIFRKLDVPVGEEVNRRVHAVLTFLQGTA
jgi:DNA-binding NarL/FixJ family response regulator